MSRVALSASASLRFLCQRTVILAAIHDAVHLAFMFVTAQRLG
jgi:hypothetical protein